MTQKVIIKTDGLGINRDTIKGIIAASLTNAVYLHLQLQLKHKETLTEEYLDQAFEQVFAVWEKMKNQLTFEPSEQDDKSRLESQ